MINGSGSKSSAVAAKTLGPRHARPAPLRLSTARAGVLRALLAADEAVTVATLAEQLGQHPNTVREHLDALVADSRVQRHRSTPEGRGRPAWLYAPTHETTRHFNAAQHLGPFDSASYGTDSQEYVALAAALIDQVAISSPDPSGLARRAGERWGRALAEKHAAGKQSSAEHTPEQSPGLHAVSADIGSTATSVTATGLAATGPADTGLAATGPADTGLAATGLTATGLTATGLAATGPVDAVVDILRELRFESEPADQPKTMRLTTCPFLDAARRNPEVVCEIHLGIVRGALEQLGGDPDTADLTAFAEPGACLLNFTHQR